MSRPVVDFRPTGDHEWARYAYCAKTGVDMFPNEMDTRGQQLARDTCAACPVVSECLTSALDRHESYGIWGGLSADERHSLIRHDRRLAYKQAALAEAAQNVAQLDAAGVA